MRLITISLILIFTLLINAGCAKPTLKKSGTKSESDTTEVKKPKHKIPEHQSKIRSLKRPNLSPKPGKGLTQLDLNPEIFDRCVKFYDYIKLRELDLFMDQAGINEFFPDRESYYVFLDTIIPPMRDRRFERNRITGYSIKAITIEQDGSKAYVKIKFYSDDILPFGKEFEAAHEWKKGSMGWYPGQVIAAKANLWDKLR